ncbi:putative ribonuclease H-like domain-containing protein [Tanacetum coccineum]
MTPRAVLLKSGTKPIALNRPVSTVESTLNVTQPKMTSFVKTTHSSIKRPFERKTTVKNQVWVPKVPTIRTKVPTAGLKVPTAKPTVAADLGNKGKAVKALARWIWKPKQNNSNQGSNSNGVSVTFKKYQYIDTQGRLKDFKLDDDRHVLLRTHRQQNMYVVDLKNNVPYENLTCLIAEASVDEIILWHRRLGHLNFKTMNKLVRNNLVTGLPSKIFENDHSCVDCLKGKHHRASCKSKLVNSISKPLHTLHMDLFGPTSISSLNNKWYCLVVTDDFSRFSRTFFLKTKDETFRILSNFITEIENLKDLKVKIIRCDNGGEFRNKDMDDFCSRKGIKREFSNARTPQQNGVAERRNRTLIEVARTMLADAKLPVTFWAEAVNTACYVQNRVLVIKPHNKTPYELFNGRVPSIGMYNKRTRHIEESLHIDFLENKAIDKGAGTKEDVKEAMMEKESPLRFITLTNLFHKVTSNVEAKKCDAALKINSPQKEQDEIQRDKEVSKQVEKEVNEEVPESSKNSLPTASEDILTNEPSDSPSTPAVETTVPTEEDIDYEEVFAPFARIEVIRLFLAYAAYMGFTVYQMDVKSAFLYGTIDEEMSAMGELNFFLGLQVIQKTDGIFLSQDKYVGDILKKYGYTNMRTTKTSMDRENPWGKDGPRKDVDLHLYRFMIGSLMYLTASRPDIMFVVCTYARHQVTPKECHLHAVKRIFRYLKGHPMLGIWYFKESLFDLVAYSDSDYDGDNHDRKSTTGGCQFLGRRLISWQYKKQTIMANSITEAEYMVAASCCRQVLWIQNQFMDYGYNFMNTKIYIDNNSAICIVKNHVYHSRTKHIDIRHHFIRDCYEKKLINVDHIHTDDNVADLLTKPFDVGRFQYLVVSIGILNP